MSRSLSFSILAFIVTAATACDPGASPTVKDDQPTGLVVGCRSKEFRVGTKCVLPPQIKVNTVGYLIGMTKRATVPAVEGVDAFKLVSSDSGEVAYEGTLAAATQNSDTADSTRVADFSSFDSPGSYVLEVEGVEASPKFRIGDDVLNEPLRVTMLGLYGLRCGVAVEIENRGDTFKHAACHLDDALLGDTKVDGTGGWHDAGDYGKYTVNAAFALAFTLKAWEDFGPGLATLEHTTSRSAALSPWLDESKYQLDQILKMQRPDGSAIHMIGPWEPNKDTTAFPSMGTLPEKDPTTRAFTGVGTAATADLAAVAAMASRVYRPFDAAYADKCLAAALAAQAFLEQNPTPIAPSFKGFTHSAYQTQDGDDRLWAQVEIWRTTGDAKLLAQIESAMDPKVTLNFDWSNVDNLARFSYVQAKSDARDPAKLEQVKTAVIGSADALVVGAEHNAYGRGIDQMYYWGINGVLARSTLNLFVANSVKPDPKYTNAAVQQIDHLLGRNPFGRSFVTGVGYLPARFPHHRPSEGDSITEPWPGLLVGGPNPNNEPDKTQYAGLAKGLFWFDQSGSYNTNEVAINWNTALAYALAGFYK